MRIDQLGALVARKRGSMGIRAAAAEVGVSPTTLSRIERGHVPDVGTLQKVCEWIEEDPAQFTGIGGLQIAFKKQQAVSAATAKSLAVLIELASKQFAEKIDAEGHDNS
ncbi:helix-turn-helix transcriptional regulator [Pelagibacterium nitratireducens]|uniref:Helix-turn-helix transcriptional regulator n=1 Tax=Pelagibacterium nitratireducens TaxID=1046114 RepID=A0ABZ2HYM0_9HYPH